MIVKDGKVLIMADRIGLSPDATPEQIVARLTELVKLASEAEHWRKEAESSVKIAADARQMQKKFTEAEAEFVVKDAVSSFKIEAVEAPRFKALYLKDKEFALAWLNEKRTNEYLKKKASLSGEFTDPVDPLAEVESRAAELMASDKSLKKGDAMLKVLGADKALAARYQEKYQGKKEGDR